MITLPVMIILSVRQTDSLLTDRRTLTRSKHLISVNCLEHISPLRFKQKKQYLFVKPSSTDILPSPSSLCLGRAGLSATKVNPFKTSCWSWQVTGQFWLYWAPGFLLSWHRKPARTFPWTLTIPPPPPALCPCQLLFLKGLRTWRQNKVLCVVILRHLLFPGLK